YRNLGNGQFVEVAASAGVASTGPSRAGLWFDYDGDHAMDLLVAGDCFGGACDGEAYLTLYRQIGPAIFQDVTSAAGLPSVLDGGHFGGMCAGDVNNDGFLDFVYATWDGGARLFQNNGDGSFSDVSASSGVANQADYWQPVMYDFDGDGWLDIYMAIDFFPNRLLINQRDGTFVDVAPAAGAANNMNDMGVTLGDYDNDQDLDIYVTNISDRGHNVLLRNDSVGSSLTFTEVSQAAGVDNGFWGWGTTFLDSHNDTLLDIAVTNGFRSDVEQSFVNDPSRFFLNQGGAPVTFADVSTAVKFDDTFWGSGLIALDYDRDGDLDMMQACVEGGPLRLLENSPVGVNPNGYLVIKPRMSGVNHWAIGTVVRISVGGTSMMRLITAGTSFMSQEPAEAFFGIGQAGTVDTVTIEWPNGEQTNLTDVPVNQVLTVPSEPAVPAASEWGVVLMTVLLITAGTLLFRWRRRNPVR
ncbi:MAG: FG-GAP-like repeat-containing protein, partial [Phycisphaerae bacterium]